MCSHKQVRFLACSAADRFPGMFVCDECDEAFRFDPNNPKGVRYLDHINPNQTKELPQLKSSRTG